MKLRIFVIFLMLLSSITAAQTTGDINQKNSEKELIRTNRIRSKSIIEYHYTKGNDGVLADSGYKSFMFVYDDLGRITQYNKYHVFTDLTVKEYYQYGKNNKISLTSRYNSKDSRIETISYKYNRKGMLKKQIHEAYYNSVRAGVYFSILANMKENDLFRKLQLDLEIDPPLETYTIIVNIIDPDENNQYVVIGDESDPSSLRYSWSQLSMESQKELLSYQGPNRKEHTYLSKFISNVQYKYDSGGNLTAKEVYNTSGDMIEKESFRYDAMNRRTGYTKYNENGKIRSSEAYIYNDEGRLSESIGLEPDGRSSGKISFRYNQNNIEEKTWTNSAGEIIGKYIYVYNNENRLTEEIKFRGENEKESKMTYKYYDDGSIEEIIRYNINNEKEKLYKYSYDHH